MPHWFLWSTPVSRHDCGCCLHQEVLQHGNDPGYPPPCSSSACTLLQGVSNENQGINFLLRCFMFKACIPVNMANPVSVKDHNEILRCFAAASKYIAAYIYACLCVCVCVCVHILFIKKFNPP